MTNKQGKILPYDRPAEQAVLGSVLLDQKALLRVAPIMDVADFFDNQHQIIYQAVLDLFNQGKNVDLVTVGNLLKGNEKVNLSYLAQLTDSIPFVSNIESYAHIVRAHAIKRKLILSCQSTMNECFGELKDVSDVLDVHQKDVLNLSIIKDLNQNQASLSEVSESMGAYIEKRFKLKDPISGIASGFYDLDRLTAGFQDSDMIVLAGRPSMGKTALALKMAINPARSEGIPVGIFSLEMSKEQLGLRYVSDLTGIPMIQLRTGNFPETKLAQIDKALYTLKSIPIYFDDTAGITVLELRAKARRWKLEQNIGMLVVDYLQLMTAKDAFTREQEINQISRGLKSIAKELNIPVIALSQLNRSLENRPNKRPQLSDLRDSGAIEQDADVVIFLYRDEVYNKQPDNPKRGIAEVIIAKQRNGPTGVVELAFQGTTSSFENLITEPSMPTQI